MGKGVITFLKPILNDIKYRKLLLAIIGLLFLSVLMSLLFQVVTNGICHTKAFFMLLASVSFWIIAGYYVYSYSKNKPWFNILFLGIFMLVANQLFVRYFVELFMHVCFGCGDLSDSWVPYLISNNLLVNMICYLGLIGFPTNVATRNKPNNNTIKHLTLNSPKESQRESTKEEHIQFSDRVFIKDGTNRFWLEMDLIWYIEVENNCIMIVTSDKKIVLYRSLKSFASLLDQQTFKRIHRSRVVNLNHTRQIINLPSGDGLVEMKDGKRFKLSRTYKKSLNLPSTS